MLDENFWKTLEKNANFLANAIKEAYQEMVLVRLDRKLRQINKGQEMCTCLPKVPDLKDGVCSECGLPRL